MPPLHMLVWIGSLFMVSVAGAAEARALLQTVDTDAAEVSDVDNERREEPVRTAVYDLYLKVNPPCPLTTTGDYNAITAPARAAFADFEREVAATPYRRQFEAGVRDAQHLLTIMDVLCQPSTTLTPEAATRRLLSETQQAIDSIRAQMRP